MLNRKPLIIAAVDITPTEKSWTRPPGAPGESPTTTSVHALWSSLRSSLHDVLERTTISDVGAAIGHNLHGRDGAAVGGAIGAIAGASIAASSSSYYEDGYYAAPAPVYAPGAVYYGVAPAYYPAAPVYYAHPRFAPRVDYAHYYGPRHFDHDHGYRDWHGNDGRHGHY